MLVAFQGACAGTHVDGAGKSTAGKGSSGGCLAPWGTRTVAALVDSTIAGNVILFAIVVFVVNK